MHGNCRLPGTGRSLHDQISSRRPADHFILLFLDRSNDLPQHRSLIFRKILGQQLIVRHYVRIKKIFQPVIFNFIRPLSFQIDFERPFIFHCVAAASYMVFIINRRQRSPPVYDDRIRCIFRDSHPSHIVGFFLFLPGILKINPAKIRLFPRLAAADQLPFTFLQLGLCIMQKSQRLLGF